MLGRRAAALFKAAKPSGKTSGETKSAGRAVLATVAPPLEARGSAGAATSSKPDDWARRLEAAAAVRAPAKPRKVAPEIFRPEEAFEAAGSDRGPRRLRETRTHLHVS